MSKVRAVRKFEENPQQLLSAILPLLKMADFFAAKKVIKGKKVVVEKPWVEK